MAEEKLELIDGMTPSLRRIYQEAERLNRRVMTLRSNIKTLEKPASMAYFRKQLKDTEQQAKATERAIKTMKAAESMNARYGAFTVGSNAGYYLNGTRIRNANMAQMAALYSRNVAMGTLRRDRLRWDTGRIDKKYGLTFDERVAKRFKIPMDSQLSSKMHNLSNIMGRLNTNTSNISMGFVRAAASLYLFMDVINRIKNMADTLFIKPADEYVSGITRVAMSSDKKLTPKNMMDQLYETAFRTRAPVDATISLYNRIGLSGVKADNERIRRFVETFNKVTAISGTQSQENRAVMLQLAQGIGSNRLGGDEFRSISEQAPLFKYFLAKGMGVNPGALKQMGAEGKLTAEAILSAMEKVQDQIDNMFLHAPMTLQQAITQLQTQWDFMVTKQFDGYLAVRDLIIDIVRWMRSAEGEETISRVVSAWNQFIVKVVAGLRQMAPYFKWILNHLPQIASSIKFMIGLLLIIVGLKKQLDFILWARNTAIGFGMATTAANAFGGALLGVAAKVNLILAGLIAYVWVLKKAWEIGQKIAKLRVEKLEYEAEVEPDKGIMSKAMQRWDTEHNFKERMQVARGAGGLSPEQEKLLKERKLYENDLYNRIKQDNLTRYNANQELREKYKAEKQAKELGIDIPSGIIGVTDSSKNIPMDVKGGKLDSVGRINDDVNLSTDSIQMMKMIAERQWVMQNEVTVPQKVEVTMDNSEGMSVQTVAKVLNEGSRIAIASSMRGEPVVV